MKITDYHAKLYAHQLTQRVNGDSAERIAASMMDSSVDLNPHQIDAALFAFSSPLSRGVILADEVGLGKTIEAGLVISQFWAERSRKILIITPSSLRKQWESELRDKFHLPATILDGPAYRAAIREEKYRNPFDRDDLVICSLPFAARSAADLERIPWDLVVIDEAHRLRNSTGKQHRAIKEALSGRRKLLLTATPLQNKLDELWSLTSLIDEQHFGELSAFRRRYSSPLQPDDFESLRSRLTPVVQRTLRVEAKEFISFTNRIPMVEEFVPTPAELELYEDVQEYLRRPNLRALPQSQRHLIAMVLYKLLASSTFAISGALTTMANRLKRQLADAAIAPLDEELAADVDEIQSTFEEWTEQDERAKAQELRPSDRLALLREIDEIEAFAARAEQITHNAKIDALKKGLRTAFAKMAELGGERKALIFTESRRTQQYLNRVLSADPDFMNGIVLFDGSNSDRVSREIYEQWKQKHAGTDRITGVRAADIRAALVDHFRDSAQIMIATEAAAEGINLQFCSLVINYDLPWNPQRIEQRIGRCHRYGQQHDVVVLNFINKENVADQRVYELLDEKFHLFSGVFGASDEVLGSIESGVDFERHVADIYQTARSPQEINASFQQLQLTLFDQITEVRESTERKLFAHFDENVAERFRTRGASAGQALDRYERMLMQLTLHELGNGARSIDDRTFVLERKLPESSALTGTYQLANRGADHEQADHLYRLGHSLAQNLVGQAMSRVLLPAHIVFDYTEYSLWRRNSAVSALKGKSGWLTALHLQITMDAGSEDHVLLAGFTDDGSVLEYDQIEAMFRLPASASASTQPPIYVAQELSTAVATVRQATLANLDERIEAWIEREESKLDEWTKDRRQRLVGEIEKLHKEVHQIGRDITRTVNLREKQSLRIQRSDLYRRIEDLEVQNRARSLEIDNQRQVLLEGAYESISKNSAENSLFTVRWSVV